MAYDRFSPRPRLVLRATIAIAVGVLLVLQFLYFRNKAKLEVLLQMEMSRTAQLTANRAMTQQEEIAVRQRETAQAVAELKAAQAQLAAQTEASIARLSAQTETSVARLSAHTEASATPPSTHPSDAAKANTAKVAATNAPQDLIPVFSMIDGVNLYQKNGTVEVYGMTYRPRAAGPIKIRSTELQLTDARADLIWTPDRAPAAGASELVLSYRNVVPSAGKVRVGLVLNNGRSFVFATPGSDQIATPPSAMLAPEMRALIASPTKAIALDMAYGAKFAAALPQEVIDALSSDDRAIQQIYVDIGDAAGTLYDIAELGLFRRGTASTNQAVKLSGRVVNAAQRLDSELVLVTETGSVARQILSSDGAFAFDGVPANAPVSLRFHHNGIDAYATLGRWFVPRTDRRDVIIDARPRYVNLTGNAPAADKALSSGDPKPAAHANVWLPHSRLIWPGAPSFPVQEYDAHTFTNNHGYLDRDRFFDNPDDCFRLVHLGSSLSNAQQVPVFQKYNIVMESEMAVHLGRCVEVISAGRDNGDIAANYRRIKNYAVLFKPDAVLLENGDSLMVQMQPDLLRRYLGADAEHNMLDNFYYVAPTKLAFRELSADWPLHAGKPDFTPLVPGIPLMSTLLVPFADMPPAGREAYAKLGDVMAYIKHEFPTVRFVVHSGLDQAICVANGDCDKTVTLADGRTTRMGAAVFIENLRSFCAEKKLDCINPVVPDENKTVEGRLTFRYDAHYSPTGHQWLAKQLEKGVFNLLALNSLEGPRR